MRREDPSVAHKASGEMDPVGGKWERVAIWMGDNVEWLLLVGFGLAAIIFAFIYASRLPMPDHWSR